MKKIKYFLLTLAIGFSVTACYDDDPINKIIPQGLTDIAVSISTPISFTAGNGNVPYTVTLPSSFTSDVDVEASLVFAGGTVKNLVTVVAGSTSASSTLGMRAYAGTIPFDGYDNNVALSVTGVAVSAPEPGDPSVFNITSNEILLLQYSTVASDALQDSSMSYIVDWNPPSIVVDIQVIDRDFTFIAESSGSGDRFESDFFNTFHPDGIYDMYARIYGSGDPTTVAIPYKVFILQPTGEQQLFEGVLPVGSPTDATRIDFADIVKSNENEFVFSLD